MDVEKGVSFVMLSMYNNLFLLLLNGLQLTRRLHWRTNHCFALVYKLLLLLALLFLLLLAFVVVVILLLLVFIVLILDHFLDISNFAPCGWEVYSQGQIRNSQL
jgi:fatty acid desaturase